MIFQPTGMALPNLQIITAIVLSFCVYLLLLSIYRLWFHPLSKFPGPKIAALTLWYEFYYDAIKKGLYTFEIQRMHEKYGPIVRISPNEIHVNDPNFIDELYAGGGKIRDKYPYFSAQFGIPESVFGTPSHHLHRLRRGALNPFFSKSSIQKIEPVIHKAIEKLCQQLQTYAGTEKPATLNMAFSCMTTDIVTQYAFNKSYNFLDSPTFEPNFHRAIVAGSDMGLVVKHFPWLLSLMKSMPPWLVTKINPEMVIYLKFQEDVRKQIKDVQDELVGSDPKVARHATIFHELLTGDLPEQEKSIARLWQEGQIVIGAGTETTAWALSVTTFYLLENPEILGRLQFELQEAIPDANERIELKRLENLPYLSAVVSEGLRLSYGVSTRLQRIDPDEALNFRSQSKTGSTIEYCIPPGTPVGMTATLIHTHPDLFPEPYEFRPERWLDEQGQRHKRLDKYLLSFSRGSRQCIGINLAYAELFMGIGLLMRRMGSHFKLHETTREDVEICYDRFVPTPKDTTQGIRVLVK
ncbi:cytochrome P450 [Penicillium sp. IBT 18751x]|nr:cytochrome P450 [Penicillium sp. IBT 18751x]